MHRFHALYLGHAPFFFPTKFLWFHTICKVHGFLRLAIWRGWECELEVCLMGTSWWCINESNFTILTIAGRAGPVYSNSLKFCSSMVLLADKDVQQMLNGGKALLPSPPPSPLLGWLKSGNILELLLCLVSRLFDTAVCDGYDQSL